MYNGINDSTSLQHVYHFLKMDLHPLSKWTIPSGTLIAFWNWANRKKDFEDCLVNYDSNILW